MQYAGNTDGENLTNLHVSLLGAFDIEQSLGRSGARFGDVGNKVLSQLI